MLRLGVSQVFFLNLERISFVGGKYKIYEPQRRNAAMQHTKECTKNINKKPLCPLRLCGSIRFMCKYCKYCSRSVLRILRVFAVQKRYFFKDT
jgi:hypothetical protein